MASGAALSWIRIRHHGLKFRCTIQFRCASGAKYNSLAKSTLNSIHTNFAVDSKRTLFGSCAAHACIGTCCYDCGNTRKEKNSQCLTTMVKSSVEESNNANREDIYFSCDRDTGLVSVFGRKGCDATDRLANFTDDDSVSPFMQFQTVIGIEIHAQLKINTKLFSSAQINLHQDEEWAVSAAKKTDTVSHNRASPLGAVGRDANTCAEPFDLGYPGTLPSLSSAAVQSAVLSAAALHCTVHKVSRFERKHYAYPDLPLGFQVTQQRWPIATDGYLDCRYSWNRQQKTARERQRMKQVERAKESVEKASEPTHEDTFFRVGVERVQIEQDTGKTIVHDGERSLVDFNRAGCALIEIVFRPHIRSAHQAASVVTTLQQLLVHVATCDGRMEDGSLRCDLNVSIAPVGNHDGSILGHNRSEQYSTFLPPNAGNRVEVKNLNSIRQVIAAAEYEALRQARVYFEGHPTQQETRTFDPDGGGRTIRTRSKGGAVDYRFLPEPDLPPLVLDEDTLGGKSLSEFLRNRPELPEEIVERLMRQYGLAEDVALVIASDPAAMGVFESAVRKARDDLQDEDCSIGCATCVDNQEHCVLADVPNAVANWLCNDLFALVKKSSMLSSRVAGGGDDENGKSRNVSVKHSRVNGSRLGSLVAMVLDGAVSNKAAKQILSVMYNEQPHAGPQAIAESRGLKLVKDIDVLRRLCEKVVLDDSNKKQLEQYRRGGKKIWKIEKYFVGKAMAASNGSAHPDLLMDALRNVLQHHSQARRHQ